MYFGIGTAVLRFQISLLFVEKVGAEFLNVSKSYFSVRDLSGQMLPLASSLEESSRGGLRTFRVATMIKDLGTFRRNGVRSHFVLIFSDYEQDIQIL